MMLKTRISPWCALLVAAACCWPSVLNKSVAADAQDKEAALIGVLKSDAAPAEKAITCKKLAVYGSKEAVPALAPLLLDKELSSWARIALEAIPDPAASDALRDAMPKLDGRLLVGVINSIAVRLDAQAVPSLTAKLEDSDPNVAAAAGEALGHIGGAEATSALQQALTSAPEAARSAIAYGCVLSAEKLMADGKSEQAAALYDRVRQANVPKQRKLEAIRGAILARGSGGLPLLLEQLRSPDNAQFGIGARTARELPGRDVTEALARELGQASVDHQVPLVLALADRNDSAVLPTVLQVAQSGPKQARVAVLGLLDRFRDLACVPVLLNAATETDADVARPAKAALARIGGKDVDADLLARLRLASGSARQVLIELAGQRRIDAALPAIMRSTEDSEKGVRRAALEAAGLLGAEPQAGELVRQISATPNQEDREDIEMALLAICRRSGTKSLPQVQPLAQTGSAALRKVGLRALASIGGTDALSTVKNAMNDREEAIQDEAVNLLATWPNTWPDDSDVAEPLLALFKSAKKPSYQAQGLQGYLQFIEGDKKLGRDEKLAKIKELLPLTTQADQKRQVIGVLGSLPTAGALELLTNLAADQSVAEEACVTALKLATGRNLADGSRDLRRKALQTIAEKAPTDATKAKATEALKRYN